MKFLQVYTDFAEAMEELNDAERGRLFMAMLKYAESGAEPVFRGNEKVLWPVAKGNIDRQAEAYAHRCEVNRRNITSRYESLPQATNRNESKQDKDKDKDKDKENIITPLSFVRSMGDRQRPDPDRSNDRLSLALERIIERLHLDLYENRPLAQAIECAVRSMYWADSIKVKGRTVSQSEIRSRLEGLTIDHVDHIMDRLANQIPDEPVTNGEAYLMACIFNAPTDYATNAARDRR